MTLSTAPHPTPYSACRFELQKDADSAGELALAGFAMFVERNEVRLCFSAVMS